MRYHEPIKATAPGRHRPGSRERFVCGRCGIELSCKSTKKTAYCDDCLPEARDLGWVPRAVRPPVAAVTKKTAAPDPGERTAA